MAIRRAPWAIALWLALLSSLAAPSARALPVLRLALAGDAAALGAGAAQPFSNPQLDALRLERPALLNDVQRPLAWVRLDSESTVEIDGQAYYAGTRANDLRARATLVRPVEVWGEGVTVALSGRLEDGALRVRNKREGVLVNLSEHRAVPQIALAARPLTWLRLGASAGLGEAFGRSFALEAVASLGQWEVGLVRRNEELDFQAEAPRGPQRRFTRPALLYDVAQTRRIALLTMKLTTGRLRMSAAWDAFHPEDAQLDGALVVAPFLVLRGGWESTRYAVDEWAFTEGDRVARVDLGVRVSRWATGADLSWGAHRVVLRHMQTELSTASAWGDNGAVTGERLLDLPQNFALYLRHIYRAALTQWAGGWSWTGQRWSLSSGLQHLRADSDTGGLVYGSALTSILSGRDVMPAASASALVLTGGLAYRKGALTVRLAAAQLLPYASSSAPPPGAKPPPPPNPNPAPKPPPTPATEQIAEAARTYSGGSIVVLELGREF